jgi:hypothetical protein
MWETVTCRSTSAKLKPGKLEPTPMAVASIFTCATAVQGSGLSLYIYSTGRQARSDGIRSIRDVPSSHVLKLHENGHIIEALKKIWWEQPVTANRTRERTGKLQDAAKVVAIQIFGFFASCGVIDVERTNVHFAPRAVAHK